MRYLLDISATAQKEVKHLPGHIRQRVRRAIRALADDPRPPRSKELDFALPGVEPRRLRIEHWRIVYAVTETDYAHTVAVVAIRKRPPYDYHDLTDIFTDLEENSIENKDAD